MLFGAATPAGFLNDKFGPRVPVAIGAVCEIVAIFMTSLCRKYYQFFLAQGVLLGLSFAFISVPAASIAPLFFPRNRGVAQGIVIAGSSLGGVIWPIVLNELLTTDNVGFGWSLRICGFMMIALLAIVVVGIQRPPHMNVKAKPKPEADEAGTSEPHKPAKKVKSDLSRLRHPSFVFLAAGLALAYFGFFVPFFFVSTYAVELGLSESFSFYLISILNAASLFGRILPGFIADRFGHFNVLTVAMVGSAVVAFCWTAASSVAGIIVWTLAYGFISGVSKFDPDSTHCNTCSLNRRRSSVHNLLVPPSWRPRRPWVRPSVFSWLRSLSPRCSACRLQANLSSEAFSPCPCIAEQCSWSVAFSWRWRDFREIDH